jgi:hypothetical protein
LPGGSCCVSFFCGLCVLLWLMIGGIGAMGGQLFQILSCLSWWIAHVQPQKEHSRGRLCHKPDFKDLVPVLFISLLAARDCYGETTGAKSSGKRVWHSRPRLCLLAITNRWPLGTIP